MLKTELREKLFYLSMSFLLFFSFVVSDFHPLLTVMSIIVGLLLTAAIGAILFLQYPDASDVKAVQMEGETPRKWIQKLSFLLFLVGVYLGAGLCFYPFSWVHALSTLSSLFTGGIGFLTNRNPKDS